MRSSSSNNNFSIPPLLKELGLRDLYLEFISSPPQRKRPSPIIKKEISPINPVLPPPALSELESKKDKVAPPPSLPASNLIHQHTEPKAFANPERPLSYSYPAPPENLPIINDFPELNPETEEFIKANDLPVEETSRLLAELNLNSPEQAKRLISLAVESNLPLKTVGRHLDLALAPGLSAEKLSPVILLLENFRHRRLFRFFDRHYHGQVSAAERFIDAFGETGENLILYYNSKRGSRFNFELRLTKNGFTIEQRGLISPLYPLKELENFLADPYKFIINLS